MGLPKTRKNRGALWVKKEGKKARGGKSYNRVLEEEKHFHLPSERWKKSQNERAA